MASTSLTWRVMISCDSLGQVRGNAQCLSHFRSAQQGERVQGTVFRDMMPFLVHREFGQRREAAKFLSVHAYYWCLNSRDGRILNRVEPPCAVESSYLSHAYQNLCIFLN